MNSLSTANIVAVVLGLLLSLIFGKFVIPMLQRLKAGQSIKMDGPAWHAAKAGTPTMGGLIFIPALAITIIVMDIVAAGFDLTCIAVLLFAMVFGVIGFVDDYAKVKKKINTGLSAKQKYLLQLIAAVLFIVVMRLIGVLEPVLYVPFVGVSVKLPWIVYIIFDIFVITGCVNAVNITDGVDGLAGGVTTVVCAFFMISFTYAYVCYAWPGSNGMSLFAGALMGALVGFLVYNFHPAKVFMGDTGSLFLGGAVCGMAIALNMPLILLPVGIIYIAETLSDILQVTCYKMTKKIIYDENGNPKLDEYGDVMSTGKRIFKMAPLHHHFEKCGWSEEKLFFVFSGITLLFCILAFMGVKGLLPIMM